MWSSNQTKTDLPGTSVTQRPANPASAAPVLTPMRATTPSAAPPARAVACLGASVEIKGRISGEEDLQIDGRVEGPVSLPGQRLIVGRTAQLNSEVVARDVIVYGKITGNLRAQDRVEIKKDGSVIGDITTTRIMIEDGAYFKGKIEIDRSKPATAAELETVGNLALVGAH